MRNQFLIKNTKIADISSILSGTNVSFIKKIIQPLQNEVYSFNFLKEIQNKISMYIDKNNLNANRRL